MSRPAVVFGGPSPEHDVSILTGLQAARALLQDGLDIAAIYWSKAGDFFSVAPDLEAEAFLQGVPAKAQPLELAVGSGGGFGTPSRLGKRKPLELSAVLNACHGGPGEDGTLQALFDLAGVRYTGPSAAGAALGMDKLAFGGAVAAAGLPALPRVVLTADSPPPPFDPPYIVKPRFGGSSIGIEVVADHGTARALARSSVHLAAGAVIEPYRPDSCDIEIAVRTYPEVQLSAIAKPLRTVDAGQILSYGDKYLGGEGMASTPRELPADLPDKVGDQVRAMARQLVDVAAIRGLTRVDFLLEGEELYVNEVNTIPGSLSLYLWVEPPLPKVTLLRDLLAEAERGPTRRYSTEGSDGTALRSAGAIASKLA